MGNRYLGSTLILVLEVCRRRAGRGSSHHAPYRGALERIFTLRLRARLLAGNGRRSRRTKIVVAELPAADS